MVDVAIFDYGAGNIFSLKTSLEKNGANVDVITSFDQTKYYDGLLLPGVGNFDPAIRSIRDYSALGFHDFVKEKIPVLGICLGMEMFFQQSQEGKEKGLDVMNGEVVLLPNDMKIPHMGWNQVTLTDNHPLFNGINSDEFFYFVHSYYVEPSASKIIKGTTRYGLNFSSVISIGNMIGVQFHPEKSGFVGLKFYENFIELVKSKKNLSCY